MAKKLDIAPLADWGYFTLPRPSTIAGPCSAETEEQIMETARGLKEIGINVFRAGIWKPRTHPGSFEGVGVEGLRWLQRVKRELGMAVSTEVASKEHVFECLKYGVDIVWIGARTTSNPFLVQEIAEALRGTDIPVLVKNPINNDIELWIGALERLNAQGVRKLGVIHRGVSPMDKHKYRNDPHWQMATELRATYPEMPFFCDPSHMGGSVAYLQEISQRAMDLGLDGLIIESHCNPSCALSDAKQQVTPSELIKLLTSLQLRENTSDDSDYRNNINQLRAQIDVCDDCLVDILARRMEVSRKIGEYKRNHSIAIIQGGRWSAVLERVVAKAAEKGLPAEYITELFNTIHEASVEAQNQLRK